MAYSSELFNDTGMFNDDEPTAAETSAPVKEEVASTLGAQAAAMADIVRDWGPARRRPEAPTFEAEGPSWSA